MIVASKVVGIEAPVIGVYPSFEEALQSISISEMGNSKELALSKYKESIESGLEELRVYDVKERAFVFNEYSSYVL